FCASFWLTVLVPGRWLVKCDQVEGDSRACARGAQAMRRPRKPTPPTTEAIDALCAAYDELFARYEERRALRQYLIGLLLPREHNKTRVELATIVPGANRQALHHFLHDAPSRRRGAQSAATGALAGAPVFGAACGRRVDRGGDRRSPAWPPHRLS